MPGVSVISVFVLGICFVLRASNFVLFAADDAGDCAVTRAPGWSRWPELVTRKLPAQADAQGPAARSLAREVSGGRCPYALSPQVSRLGRRTRGMGQAHGPQ